MDILDNNTVLYVIECLVKCIRSKKDTDQDLKDFLEKGWDISYDKWKQMFKIAKVAVKDVDKNGIDEVIGMFNDNANVEQSTKDVVAEYIIACAKVTKDLDGVLKALGNKKGYDVVMAMVEFGRKCLSAI